mmetsp:Transcript_10262/g.15528  ORF Transcript_10262/g.15528 Transcript_10262/m.15528 type:complete len:265 (-) Transcript_10262:69-863(-)
MFTRSLSRGTVKHATFCNAYRRLSSAKETIEAIGTYDATQIGLMLKDDCIMVDPQDNIVGNASKKDCHLTSNSYLHRAFSVLLFDSENRLLMQQRARHKITFPLYWTNTCCSHPLFVEEHCEIRNKDSSLQIKIDGVKNAAVRRLHEELGIPTEELHNIEDFKFMTRILYKAECDDANWTEHELDYILIMRKNVTLHLNENEVEDIKYCTPKELEQMLNDTQLRISPWFKILYQSGYVSQWWKDLDNIVKKQYTVDTQIHNFYT